MPLSPRPAKATAFTLGAACVVLWFTLTNALWGTDWFWHPGWDGVALVAALPAGAALILGIRWLARAQPTGRHGSWAFAGVVVVLLAGGAVFFGVVINQEWGHCGPTPSAANWSDPGLYAGLAAESIPPATGFPTGERLPQGWALASVYVSHGEHSHGHTTWFDARAPDRVEASWFEDTDVEQMESELAAFLARLGRADPIGDAKLVLADPVESGRLTSHDGMELPMYTSAARFAGGWNATALVADVDAWAVSIMPGWRHTTVNGLDLRVQTPVKHVEADDRVSLRVDEAGQVEVRAVLGEMGTTPWLERVQAALEPYDVQVPREPEMSVSIC